MKFFKQFKLRLFIFLFSILLIHNYSFAQTKTDDLEIFLQNEMQKRRIPGLQIAVVRQGKIVFSKAFGMANLQDSIPVDERTVFTINSATKAFTGVAVMQLAEEGKLDLNAAVGNYFDDLPTAWQKVTIRQMLTHNSGLPNIMDDDANLIAENESAAWEKVKILPMEFTPGERFSYNQTNYLLLGCIIEKLSGKPFTQFITERQFRVVKMPLTEKAGFGDFYDVKPHSARNYTYFRGENITNVFEAFPPSLRTAAGMSSTTEEIAKWIIALQQGKLFKHKDSLQPLWSPGILSNGSTGGFSRLLNGYALGFPVVGRAEHPAIAAIGGGRFALFIYPKDDLAIVIATNLQGASPESFIDEVAGHYITEMKAANGFGLPPAVKLLRAELLKLRFENALNVVNEQKKKNADFTLAEDELNEWGYKLLEQKQVKEAIEIFKLNASLYPQSANVYDSLAEAYETNGNKPEAIKNYKRSLELDPQNTNAVRHLKNLDPNYK